MWNEFNIGAAKRTVYFLEVFKEAVGGMVDAWKPIFYQYSLLGFEFREMDQEVRTILRVLGLLVLNVAFYLFTIMFLNENSHNLDLLSVYEVCEMDLANIFVIVMNYY